MPAMRAQAESTSHAVYNVQARIRSILESHPRIPHRHPGEGNHAAATELSNWLTDVASVLPPLMDALEDGARDVHDQMTHGAVEQTMSELGAQAHEGAARRQL